MTANARDWLGRNLTNVSVYELLDHPLLDPDVEGLQRAIRRAHREAHAFQSHADPAVVQQAMEYQRALARFEAILADPQKLRDHQRPLVAKLRQSLREAQIPLADSDTAARWLSGVANVQAETASRLAKLLSHDDDSLVLAQLFPPPPPAEPQNASPPAETPTQPLAKGPTVPGPTPSTAAVVPATPARKSVFESAPASAKASSSGIGAAVPGTTPAVKHEPATKLPVARPVEPGKVRPAPTPIPWARPQSPAVAASPRAANTAPAPMAAKTPPDNPRANTLAPVIPDGGAPLLYASSWRNGDRRYSLLFLLALALPIVAVSSAGLVWISYQLRGPSLADALEPWPQAVGVPAPLKSEFEPGADGVRLVADGGQPTWSPEGNRLAYAKSDGAIWVLDLVTGVSQTLVEKGHSPAWSPAGGRLAYILESPKPNQTRDESEVWLYDLTTQRSLRIAAGLGPTWNRTTGALVYITADRRQIMQLLPGSASPTVVMGHRDLEQVAISPDGGSAYLLAANERGKVSRRYELATGEPATDDIDVNGPVCFATSGDRLAVAFERLVSGIEVRDLQRNSIRRVALGPFSAPAWAPQMNYLAFEYRPPTGTNHEIWLVDADRAQSNVFRHPHDRAADAGASQVAANTPPPNVPPATPPPASSSTNTPNRPPAFPAPNIPPLPQTATSDDKIRFEDRSRSLTAWREIERFQARWLGRQVELAGTLTSTGTFLDRRDVKLKLTDGVVASFVGVNSTAVDRFFQSTAMVGEPLSVHVEVTMPDDHGHLAITSVAKYGEESSRVTCPVAAGRVYRNSPVVLVGIATGANELLWHPKGEKLIVSAMNRTAFQVYDASQGTSLVSITGQLPRWNDKGNLLAYAANHEPRVVLDSGNAPFILTEPLVDERRTPVVRPIQDVQWRPAQAGATKPMLAIRVDDRAALYYLNTAERKVEKPNAETGIRTFAWSPDGKWLALSVAAGTQPNSLRVVRPEANRTAPPFFQEIGVNPERLVWRGQALATAEEDGNGYRVRIYNFASVANHAVAKQPFGAENQPINWSKTAVSFADSAWSPDGTTWAVMDATQNKVQLYRRPLDIHLAGSKSIDVGFALYRKAALAWSPDGKWLAIPLRYDGSEKSADAVLLTTVASPWQKWLLASVKSDGASFANSRPPSLIQWSPDGKRLAVAYEGGQVAIFASPAENADSSGQTLGQTSSTASPSPSAATIPPKSTATAGANRPVGNSSATVLPEPYARFRFDGDVRNEGTGKATWELLNTNYEEGALFCNGVYRPLDPRPNGSSDPRGYRALCAAPDIPFETFTVALRFKPSKADAQRTNIISAGPLSRWFGLERGAKNMLLATFNQSLFIPTTGEIMLDSWNVVAVAADLKEHTVAICVNGKLVKHEPLPGDLVPNALKSQKPQDERRWSFSNYGNGEAFCGYVDEFLLYDRALEAEQLPLIPLRP